MLPERARILAELVAARTLMTSDKLMRVQDPFGRP